MNRTLLAALLLTPALASAAAPQWVLSDGRSSDYPEGAYFTGFGEAMLGPDADTAKCAELAWDNAKRNLIQAIQVTVKSVARSKAEEAAGQYSEYASAVTESVSSLDLKGLKRERYSDAKKKTCYGLAIVAKAALARDYAAKGAALKSEISARVAAAKGREETGDRAKALDEYLGAQKLLAEYREVLGVVNLASRGAADFGELAAGEAGEGLPSVAEIKAAVERLAAKPVRGLEDAAWLLAFYLKEQAGLPEAQVQVQPFTFRDTRMASPFARFFKQLLEGKLAETAKWGVVEPRIEAGKDASGAGYAVTGSYWPREGGLRILAKLRRVSDGRVAASTELAMPLEAVA